MWLHADGIESRMSLVSSSAPANATRSVDARAVGPAVRHYQQTYTSMGQPRITRPGSYEVE